jgi:prephenate dehydrogenase
MQQVAIIGLGLIGSSIGLGLRRWSEANGGALRIVGFDSDMPRQQQAQRLGALDDTQWSLNRAVAEADLVVVATPVGAMESVFTDIGPTLKSGAVVTDTGSTKADVLQWAEQTLPAHVSFVGGHPMAGKAESIEAAEAALFTGATWCVCPSVQASEEAVTTVLGMINALGAESFFVDPTEHDAYVAGVSHLPFVLSAALMATVARDPSWRDMRTLSASGFRDTTRLALGSPQMHRDILLTNREAVIRWTEQLTATLAELRDALSQPDQEAASTAVERFLTEARDARAEWAAQERRSSEQRPATADELSKERVGEQMSRMFLGGLGRRRRFGREEQERPAKVRDDRR